MIGIWVCMCCVSTTSLWLFSDASHCWKHCWVVGKCIQLQALRREVGVGVKPLPETMVALARLFGAKGQLQRGEEVLAAMEKLNHDPRVAWLVLVGNFSLSLSLSLPSLLSFCSFRLVFLTVAEEVFSAFALAILLHRY